MFDMDAIGNNLAPNIRAELMQNDGSTISFNKKEDILAYFGNFASECATD